MRQISQEGVDFIKHWEGCKLTAYRDIVGIPTIGVGHTGPEVHDGLTITQDQADELLRSDLGKVYRTIANLVTVDLNDNQYAALCSFIFNLGEHAFSESTLLKKLNAGDFDGAANEFQKWCHAGKNEVEGLLKRRLAERDMFLKTPSN